MWDALPSPTARTSRLRIVFIIMFFIYITPNIPFVHTLFKYFHISDCSKHHFLWFSDRENVGFQGVVFRHVTRGGHGGGRVQTATAQPEDQDHPHLADGVPSLWTYFV